MTTLTNNALLNLPATPLHFLIEGFQELCHQRRFTERAICIVTYEPTPPDQLKRPANVSKAICSSSFTVLHIVVLFFLIFGSPLSSRLTEY